LRFWPAEGVATFAAVAVAAAAAKLGVEAKASEAEAAEGLATLVATAAAAITTGRPLVAVVVKSDITEEATAAIFVVEVAVAGVGRSAAAAIVTVLDGKATSAFPDKSIQIYLNRYGMTDLWKSS
jgi:hypothetical protein